jgi:hypothetical protein
MVEVESLLHANARSVLVIDSKNLLAKSGMLGQLRPVRMVPHADLSTRTCIVVIERAAGRDAMPGDECPPRVGMVP